ncbi:16S rRNA (cytidine(1402)-2'-O)-methyltransferase [Salsipaludibacter albus]|uniref:16S rRNA (cytidine(1402)-2'-O)-methyltransferase n=1 Tax=Salsipaludibacter albus TaxID=2849650 RepID=UPI001EE446CA|nr:16S rRNA (cytidine(1402)-2'-O)-methyltransferase [Salsipaludibacter albus]MBY5161950.1 16S rRNA (cytidine(1402)-2'-O)-methyltransferase [Salsipaludibacter albus]
MTEPAATDRTGSPAVGEPGVLRVVATPIGNLRDLAPRAADALRTADLVCAEDTRRTGRLLAHLDADTPQWSLHDHNERGQVPAVLARLAAGDTVALVSDAGTPGVSDPGHRLIAATIAAGHVVEPIPGPSAPLAALVGSGLPMDRFVMEGFLPRRGAARQERLAALADEPRTMVVFLSPHRAAADLDDLATACGHERPASLGRELTKLHEEHLRGPLGELVARAGDLRGELTLVVAGRPDLDDPTDRPDDATLRARVAAAQETGLAPRAAVKTVAAEAGMPTRELYDLVHRDGST